MASKFFLCLASVCGAAPVTAPHWHTGEWWRVRVAQIVVSKNCAAIRDSTTHAVTYRFQVVGKRMFSFEEQDGKEHIGQTVPPEDCWLVVVKEEPGPRLNQRTSYHLYFRVGDLSLREVVEQGGQRETYFVYGSTHVDDDDPESVVVVNRSQYRSGFGPPFLDWPHFPLAVGSAVADGAQKVVEIKTHFNGAEITGARVVLGNGKDRTTQIWRPGLPWWIAADRNGLQQSQLIETSDDQLSGKIKAVKAAR